MALDKKCSYYFRIEVKWDSQKLLEELTITVQSTVAASSNVGKGLSCFCPEIVVRWDDFARYHVFNRLLYGPMEFSWVFGSTVEASKAFYKSFAQKEKQMGARLKAVALIQETSCPGFQFLTSWLSGAPEHLPSFYNKHGWLLFDSFHLELWFVAGHSVDDTHSQGPQQTWCKIHHQFGLSCHMSEVSGGGGVTSVQDFVWLPSFTQSKFLSDRAWGCWVMLWLLMTVLFQVTAVINGRFWRNEPAFRVFRTFRPVIRKSLFSARPPQDTIELWLDS